MIGNGRGIGLIKVCHMTSVHSNSDLRIFYKECVSLATAGYEVYLVASGENREEKGVHVIGVGKTVSSRLKRMTKLTRKVYQSALKLDCDIYHLHDPELLPYALKLKRKGKKVIFDSHEDVLHSFIDKKWIPALIRKPVARAAAEYFRRVLPKFDALVSVTPHLHKELQRLNPNTHMITNYPIIEQDAVICESKKASDMFTLIFTGGITPQWSHEVIIQTIQEINNVQYLVYGKCDEAYLAKLKALDQKAKFVYKGLIPQKTVKDVLLSASVGMALCKYSNNTAWGKGSLGNTKLFEYMLAGLPVICTDFDLWKGIVEASQCGICVNPDDIKQISETIEKLLGNPDMLKKMGMAGRAVVIEKYNWEIGKNLLLKVYKDFEQSIISAEKGV